MPHQTAHMTDRARELRREQTEPERLLWGHLRARRLGGHRFRRQHPLGPYVLDLYCPEARLAVEIDGSGHLDRTEADEARTRWLAARGVRVLRVWNHEVSGQLEAVLQRILEALEERSEQRDVRSG